MADASAAACPPSSARLDGRVILVTGATGGLGQAAALACARAGATLVLSARRVPRLERLYDAVAAIGPEPLLYPLDLHGATPGDYAELVERLRAGPGRLDGLLHCAAEFRGLTPLPHAPPEDLARAIHVNLTAPLWLTQACLPLLSERDDAAIVLALDSPTRTGGAYWGGYGLAQSSRAALLRMLAEELATSSVRVSGLQPGPMRTGLRARAYVEGDDREALDPACYAEACVALLSPQGATHRGQLWSPLP